MLLQFSIKNYRVFKDKVTLSLLATNYDKDTRETENVSNDAKFNLRLLKSAVVYGANASGKSKLIEALVFMRGFVIHSSKESQVGDLIDIDTFRLNTETQNAPSEFEVLFTHNNIMYRYGFEVTEERVISEWLYYRPKTKEIELFYRENNEFQTHDRNFSKGNLVIKEGLVRDNALLVSVAAQFNDPICTLIIDWFKNLKLINELHEKLFKSSTISKIKTSHGKNKILELLKAADIGIEDIKYKSYDDEPVENSPNELKIFKDAISQIDTEIFSDILTIHSVYDKNKNAVDKVEFSTIRDESKGTEKFLYLCGTIIDVLENGGILVADEFDAKLHPNLVCKIVALFNSKEFNKNNAQLIFNTHDTNLLSLRLFRRDQIWFIEKNKFGEAKLYSLADFKSEEVRKTESFEENYIRGKYGAVPYLSFFDNLNERLAV